MQLNSTSIPNNSLQVRIGPALKRPYSATTSALKVDSTSDRSTKLQRFEEAPGEGSRNFSRALEGSILPEMPSTSRRGGGKPISVRSRGTRDGRPPRARSGAATKSSLTSRISQLDSLTGPFMDEKQINEQNADVQTSSVPLSGEWRFNPKSALANFMLSAVGKPPEYVMEEGKLNGRRICRYLNEEVWHCIYILTITSERKYR